MPITTDSGRQRAQCSIRWDNEGDGSVKRPHTQVTYPPSAYEPGRLGSGRHTSVFQRAKKRIDGWAGAGRKRVEEWVTWVHISPTAGLSFLFSFLFPFILTFLFYFLV
jgi:hypothetical protein